MPGVGWSVRISTNWVFYKHWMFPCPIWPRILLSDVINSCSVRLGRIKAFMFCRYSNPHEGRGCIHRIMNVMTVFCLDVMTVFRQSVWRVSFNYYEQQKRPLSSSPKFNVLATKVPKVGVLLSSQFYILTLVGVRTLLTTQTGNITLWYSDELRSCNHRIIVVMTVFSSLL